MATKVILIAEDGSLRTLWTPDVVALAERLGGAAVKRRASHVEPVNLAKRVVFSFVRRVVRDDSAAAGWTRRSGWGPWRVRMVGGPTLPGTWARREEAIRAEVAWLQARM